MKLSALKQRINELIELAEEVLSTRAVSSARNVGGGIVVPGGRSYVSSSAFQQLRLSTLAFISNVFGTEHPFYQEFYRLVDTANPTCVLKAQGILHAVKGEIDGGWLFTVKRVVSAEIFTDFLEMAGYLLEEGYKDPAAVMIGGVLEEQLRQLCIRNNIDPFVPKDGKEVPKSSDRMNNELSAAGVYNKLYQKSVTGWLDLRNKAAHGHYSEYSQVQVQLMEQGVLDFVARNSES